MEKREITVLTDVSLITCIVQRGSADALIQAAMEVGAQGATTSYGRGCGVRERLGLLGLTIEAGKEIINIIVSNDQRDRIFEKMYIVGKLDTPGMGVIYITPLEKVATFIPADVTDRLEQLANKRNYHEKKPL
jgi:nitrogen regulatory protein P-II 1